jgi:hypothetical protein
MASSLAMRSKSSSRDLDILVLKSLPWTIPMMKIGNGNENSVDQILGQIVDQILGQLVNQILVQILEAEYHRNLRG